MKRVLAMLAAAMLLAGLAGPVQAVEPLAGQDGSYTGTWSCYY